MKTRVQITLILLSLLLTACSSQILFTLYYYNPQLDKDAAGNIQCSSAGLVPVQRVMNGTPNDQEMPAWIIKSLLTGQLTEDERAQGITTEFPLEGVELQNYSIRDGVLTLTFSDPEHRTSGGACRAAILWAQIEQTALQFPGVSEVRFLPEDLFQP
ncbi:MAG TPA: GerMN domain-containing protein [Terriglobales bacterium]|nr:GerMN domain-containing protein [Terriglobales bacterium]